MKEKKEKKDKKQKKTTAKDLPNQAINAYTEGADPLGSYTGTSSGTVFPGKNMPRREADGKIYVNVENTDRPIQDADDL